MADTERNETYFSNGIIKEVKQNDRIYPHITRKAHKKPLIYEYGELKDIAQKTDSIIT